MYERRINDSRLETKHQEKDLGILFTTKFKFNKHMDAVISKANRQLGIITRVFKHKNIAKLPEKKNEQT